MAGQLIAKGKDKWLLRVYQGKDTVTGKRRYRSVTFIGGKNQARVELDRLLQLQKEGHAFKPTQMTVNEFFDRWFEMVAANRYSYKTYENYKGIIAYDVRSLIGQVELPKLKPTHIQSIFTAMKERGVCSNTRRRLYSVISTAFDWAVSWGALELNPTTHIEIP